MKANFEMLFCGACEKERETRLAGQRLVRGFYPLFCCLLSPSLSPLHSLAKKSNKISHMKRNEAENVVKEKRNVNDMKIVKIGKLENGKSVELASCVLPGANYRQTKTSAKSNALCHQDRADVTRTCD